MSARGWIAYGISWPLARCRWWLAQDRDRFAREPAYHYLLREEFAERGTTIRSLDDSGDDSLEGELAGGILDQLAKYQRAKIAESTHRGRLRRVREGKLVAGGAPNYGFKFNHDRDGYEVDEDDMSVVRRIFWMVGVEGRMLHDVCSTLRKEGVPTPGGGKLWSPTFVRNMVKNDVYKPHTFEEVREVVTEQVATTLNPDERYGLWWYNKNRIRSKQTARSGPDGRRYHRSKKPRRNRSTSGLWHPCPAWESHASG